MGKRINMNDIAKKVTLIKGGKVSINIAQVKEILKIFLQILAKLKFEDVVKLLLRYR